MRSNHAAHESTDRLIRENREPVFVVVSKKHYDWPAPFLLEALEQILAAQNVYARIIRIAQLDLVETEEMRRWFG